MNEKLYPLATYPALAFAAAALLWGAAAVPAQARTLTVTSSASDFTLQVGDGTNLADFKLNFTESLGAGINEWKDVNSESSPTDFGPELTAIAGGTCQYQNLFNLNIGKTGTGNDLTDACATTGTRLIAQEVSPVRAILYGTSPLAPWNGGTASTSWSINTKYTVYANGRIYGTRTVNKLTDAMNASTWHYPMRIFSRYDAGYPYGFIGFDESRGDLAFNTSNDLTSDKFDDYWGFQATTSDWVGDIALGFYSDWALSDLMNNNKFTTTLYSRIGLKDNTSRQWNPGTTDTFNYMALLKPNNLNVPGAVRPYYQDYRYPDRPTVATGAAEEGSLGDGDSDGWNEDEGAYEVRAAGHVADITLHGQTNASTTINTLECFPGDASVEVASTDGFDSAGYAYLANGRDVFSYTGKTATFLTGIPGTGTFAIASCDDGDRVTAHSLYDPVVKLHEFYPKTGTTLATRTVQHLRLDDNAANTTVAATVGTNGTASGNTSGLTTTSAPRVRGLTIDDDGEYVQSTVGDLADWGQGTIELWYRPNYDFNQGSAPTKYIFGSAAAGSTKSFYLAHLDSGSGYNVLRFGITDALDVSHSTEVRTSDYADLWKAYEWVHLRVTWDSAAGTDNLKIYVNGQYPTQYGTGEATWDAFNAVDYMYWGDYQAAGTDNAEGALDDIYIHNDVVAGHPGAPVVLESIYGTGTVTTAAGSSTITGAGTSWLANLTAGQAIRVMADGDEQWYEIASVDVDTSLTLTRPYRGTGSSGKSYEAGGTPVALPQLTVAGTPKELDSAYNLATAGPVSSYVAQYLATVSTNQQFVFGLGLSTSTLTQSRFRFYDNANVLTPTDPWPVGGDVDTAENTAIATSTGPDDGDVLRLRLALQVNDLDLSAGTQAFKLQYAEAWTCSAVSAWSDVGDAASTTAPWRGYGNAGVSDGAAVQAKVLSTADVAGSYEEENNSAQNPYAVGVGQDVEYDWVLHARDINQDSSYCFRMVKSNGTALDSYSQYPRISTTSSAPAGATITQSRYRLYANANAVTPTDPWPSGGTDLAENTAAAADNGPVSGNVLRFRIGLTVATAQLDAASQAFKLQFGTGGTCSAVSDWQDVPDGTSSTAAWRGYDNASPADGATISSLVLSTATVGGSYEESNDSVANPNAVPSGDVGEWDWAVEANALAEETSYCFRMVKANGDVLDTYSVYPQLTTTSTTFDVSHEGGNGQDFSRTGNSVSFNGELDIGAGTDKRTTWFDFSMNFAKAKSISFSMGNARGSNTETNVWTGKRPLYSYDRVTWTPVSADGSGGASLDDPFLWTAPGGTATFTADTVYIAYNVPYTYTDAQNDIARWQGTGYVSSTVVIGQSVQGRDQHLLTFNDVNSPVREYQKKVLWLTARQHPMESLANYQLRGIVDFYTNTSTPESLVFRRNWILKVVPDVSPDAMYHGWTRANANGEDLNREWATGGPNVSEEIEVRNIHQAMQDWEDAGGAFTAYLDMHTQSSALPSAFYADATFDSQVLYDNLTHLGNSLTTNAFSNGSYAIDAVRADYGPPSWTVEGPDVRWNATNHPTEANGEGWGRAWGMAVVTTYTPSTTAKIFAFHEIPESDGASTKTLVTAPGKFHLVFDDAKGGALTYWYDIENQTTHGAQLGDTTYGVDRLEWHDGTAVRALASSTATTTIQESNGAFVKLVTTGVLGGVSGLNYTLTRFIGEDGRIFSTFALTNGTGGNVDWGTMTQYLSVNNTNFNFVYDNTDATPTPGTDRWFAQVGTSGGTPAIKAVAAQHFVTSSASFVYDTYGSQTGTPRWNYYRDADGPSQANGATVTTTWALQLNPDNDTNGTEGQLDAYSDDLTHFDSPTASVGTYLGLATTSGAMLFAASGNEAKFTYTNAATFPKKKPIFMLTGYTADTAPVLKLNGSFLDGEDGSAHSTSTHVSSTYTSYVSTTLDIAYVQYLGDISSNVEVQIGSVITGGSAPTAPSGAAATYNSDSQITLAWTDASSDEDSFAVERRTDTGAGYGSYTHIATTSANAVSYADTSVAANRKYQYRVRAYNAAGGYSSYSTDGSDVYTTPSAPSQPSGSADSVSAITWTWTDNAAFESSYRLGFSANGSSSLYTLAADAASYQVTGLATNTTSSVVAAAYRSDRGAASSTASAEVYTLSAIPTGGAAVDDSTTQITASWNANGNPSGTEYYAENTTASTNSGWITATSWASTGLACGTSYTFHVRSRNGAGTATSYTGDFSTSTAACPTAPTAPSGAAATYDSDSQITLSWTDNASNEDSFAVERRTDTGAGYGGYAHVATTSANAVSYADTSVAANRKYQYRVRAYNVAGYSSYSTDAGDVFTTPGAPSTPAGVADSVSAITWSWTDNAAFESSYRFGLTSGGTDYVSGQAADLTSYQVTGLSTNMPYRGQAAAYRADRGVASSSASAIVYTLAAVPSSLGAAEDSGTQITASWNANGNPGGTEYYAENVTAGTDSGWTTATTWASTGLTCSTAYDFRVRARNGDSIATSFTASVTATTTSSCPATPQQGGSTGAPAVIPSTSGSGRGSLDPTTGGIVSNPIPSASGMAQAVFPPGAIGGAATVFVIPQTAEAVRAQAPLPAGTSIAAGMAAQITVSEGVFPVTTVGLPVTIRFTYLDTALGGLPESSLAIYRWDSDTRTWLRLPDSTVDAALNVVTATTQHFSLFAVLASGSPAVQPSGGRLIKVAGDPRVYVVTSAGFRRHIPSEAAFLSYGYRWQDIQTVGAATLSSYPTTALLKVAGDPKIYRAADGVRRWIPDEATFLGRGYTWNAVSTVSAAEMAAYTDGPTLTVSDPALGTQTATPPAPAAPASGTFRSFLSVGSSGAEVRLLQAKLRAAGYFTYPSDTGLFGAVTRDAVARFQAAHGIDPVGYVGPATRDALNALP